MISIIPTVVNPDIPHRKNLGSSVPLTISLLITFRSSVDFFLFSIGYKLRGNFAGNPVG